MCQFGCTFSASLIFCMCIEMYGNVTKVLTRQFGCTIELFELALPDLRQIRAFGQQYGHYVFHLPPCVLSLKIWEKSLEIWSLCFTSNIVFREISPKCRLEKHHNLLELTWRLTHSSTLRLNCRGKKALWPLKGLRE